MPLSPSMNVIALLHDAVFMNAGSYVMIPNSSGAVFIGRRSIARTAVSPSGPPSTMGTEYFLLLRESVISSVPVCLNSPVGAGAVASLVLAMPHSPWVCYQRLVRHASRRKPLSRLGPAPVCIDALGATAAAKLNLMSRTERDIA